MSYTMPAEWEQHERTWMAWPTAGYMSLDEQDSMDDAFAAWSNVANTKIGRAHV